MKPNGLVAAASITSQMSMPMRSATTADITASIQPRRDIEKLGVAPLTSMFFYGEDGTRKFDDFRPEVHDSDGLEMVTGAGQRLWRVREVVRLGGIEGELALPRPHLGHVLLREDGEFHSYQMLEAGTQLFNELRASHPEAASRVMVAITRYLARDLGEHNIRVNTLHPTGVETAMGEMADAYPPLLEKHPRVGGMLTNMLPIETTQPRDQSNAVLFLATLSGGGELIVHSSVAPRSECGSDSEAITSTSSWKCATSPAAGNQLVCFTRRTCVTAWPEALRVV